MRRPEIGEVIADKYVIEQLLGEGGYAWVFRASNVRIPTLQYAIKVLKPQHVRDRDVVKRFRREAETAARMDNRHIVRIMDFGQTTRGIPYITMEFVRGEPMDAVIRRLGYLRQSDVARFTIGILKALDTAHSFGIVHRDLKPGNILIVKEKGERQPIARVTDFGIAKVLQQEPGLASDTGTVDGVVLCTPNYASPELLRGEPTTASDIYALGHLMAEMLDGYPPYRVGSSVQIATRHLDARQVPFGKRCKQSVLFHIVSRACAKPLEYRYQTAKDMLRDLRAAASYIPGRATDEPLELRVPPQLTLQEMSVVRDDSKDKGAKPAKPAFSESAPTEEVEFDPDILEEAEQAKRKAAEISGQVTRAMTRKGYLS